MCDIVKVAAKTRTHFLKDLSTFHYIDEIRNVRKLVTFLFCFIQYINTTTHSIKDLNLFGMYLCIDFIADICIAIQSHQSN
jgi:hypothetical protein